MIIALFTLLGVADAVRGDLPAPPEASGVAPPDFAAVTSRSGDGPGGEALDGLGLSVTPLPESASLTGPNFSVRFDAVATVSELPISLIEALGSTIKPARAGDGREFLVTHTAAPPVRTDRFTRLTVDLVVDGVARTVDQSALRPGAISVFNVPVGIDPQLRVTDEGRAQSLALRSGARQPDAIAGFYPLRTGSTTFVELLWLDGITFPLPNGTPWRYGELTASCSATLTPYERVMGWSAPGRLWLALRCSASFDAISSSEISSGHIAVEQAITVRTPDDQVLSMPTAIAVVLTNPLNVMSNPSPGLLVGDAPEGLPGITLSFRFAGALKSSKNGEPVTWRTLRAAEPKSVSW